MAVERESNIEFDGLVMDQSMICGYVKKTSRMLLRFWLSGYQRDVPTLDYQDSLGHAVPTRAGEYISILFLILLARLAILHVILVTGSILLHFWDLWSWDTW